MIDLEYKRIRRMLQERIALLAGLKPGSRAKAEQSWYDDVRPEWSRALLELCTSPDPWPDLTPVREELAMMLARSLDPDREAAECMLEPLLTVDRTREVALLALASTGAPNRMRMYEALVRRVRDLPPRQLGTLAQVIAWSGDARARANLLALAAYARQLDEPHVERAVLEGLADETLIRCEAGEPVMSRERVAEILRYAALPLPEYIAFGERITDASRQADYMAEAVLVDYADVPGVPTALVDLLIDPPADGQGIWVACTWDPMLARFLLLASRANPDEARRAIGTATAEHGPNAILERTLAAIADLP